MLSCYDRVVIPGTLPGVCGTAGMTSFLYARKIRIFDYTRFAGPLRERTRARAQVQRLPTTHRCRPGHGLRSAMFYSRPYNRIPHPGQTSINLAGITRNVPMRRHCTAMNVAIKCSCDHTKIAA